MQIVNSKFIASCALSMFALLGCGGSDSNGGGLSAEQVKDACVRICQKQVSCNPGFPVDCNQQCSDSSSNDGTIPSACKTDATLQKVNACLDGACTALNGCLANATSSCSGTGGSTGTGGTTSTGGRTSTGGTSTGTGGASSGDCSVCTKARNCCVALAAQSGADASACDAYTSAVSMCTSAGANQSVYIESCQAVLSAAASSNIAACK